MPQKLVMPRLGAELDRESYQWLAANHPDILAAVEAEVSTGAKPTDLRFYVLRLTGRPEIAQRIEAAARHIANSEQSEKAEAR
jgi:hypothetical protein